MQPSLLELELWADLEHDRGVSAGKRFRCNCHRVTGWIRTSVNPGGRIQIQVLFLRNAAPFSRVHGARHDLYSISGTWTIPNLAYSPSRLRNILTKSSLYH